MAGISVPGDARSGIRRRWVRKRISSISTRSQGSAISNTSASSRAIRGSTDSRSATARGMRARADASGVMSPGCTVYSPSQVAITLRSWSWVSAPRSARIWPMGRCTPLPRSSCCACRPSARSGVDSSPAWTSASPRCRALPTVGWGVEIWRHSASALWGRKLWAGGGAEVLASVIGAKGLGRGL